MAPSKKYANEYASPRGSQAMLIVIESRLTHMAARSLEVLGYTIDRQSHHGRIGCDELVYSCNDKVYMRTSPVDFQESLTILAIGYKDESSGGIHHVYAVQSSSYLEDEEFFVLREKDIVTKPDHEVGSTLIFNVRGIELPVKVAEVLYELKSWRYRLSDDNKWHYEWKINEVLEQ